jgi:hypothetical protein
VVVIVFRAHVSPSQTPSTAVSSEHGDDDDAAAVSNAQADALDEADEECRDPARSNGDAEKPEDNDDDNDDDDKNHEEDVADGSIRTKKSVINGHASPFYPSGYLSPSPPVFMPQSQNSRPNLFLYSPSSNTMIPCEEIVIPNPVVGPEGSTIYQGPSNIYLAFPCESGSGALGSPHSFPAYMGAMASGPLVHYDQYGVPYSPYQQQQPPGSSPPTGDADDHSLAYTSETGTEPSSADSTLPHSPPDLSSYSPANWADAKSFVPQNSYSPWFQQQQPANFYGPLHPKRPSISRQSSYRGRHHFSHLPHRPLSSSFLSERVSATLPSSGGDSLAEEEEDNR